MIELLISLIKQLINLEKEKQRSDLSLFNGFVQPLIEQFEEVHLDYVGSFLKYRTLIENDSNIFDGNHQVFSEIEKDQLFSMHLREKIHITSNMIQSNNMKSILVLTHKILEYLAGGSDIQLESSNVHRKMLNETLKSIANNESTVMSISMLENIYRFELTKELTNAANNAKCDTKKNDVIRGLLTEGQNGIVYNDHNVFDDIDCIPYEQRKKKYCIQLIDKKLKLLQLLYASVQQAYQDVKLDIFR